MTASADPLWCAQGDELHPLFAGCFGEAALAEALVQLTPDEKTP